jgi:lactate racemase
MQISLTFGKSRLNLTLPSGISADSFAPDPVVTTVDQLAFRHELKRGDLPAFLSNGSMLIVVNDAYRHTPTAQILDWLDREDGTLLDRAQFLIATGSHPPATEAHLATIFGRHLGRIRARISSHVATDQGSLRQIGLDSFGAPVLVNKALIESDATLIIGSVEPHYFAGYTGGRKSLVPGLLDLATIERNHNLANSMAAAPLRLAGNPVAEHLDSLLTFLPLGRIRSLQLVAAGGRLAGVFCGEVRESFDRAVVLANDLFAHKVTRPYDIVLCELLPPLSHNLYQSQKALENCQMGVADGGAAVVIAPCEEGIGSSFFYQLADQWDREKNEPVDGISRFGSHKLSRVNAIGRRIDVRLYSGLADREVRRVYYEPVGDLEEYIRERAARRPGLLVAVVHDAGNTVLTC